MWLAVPGAAPPPADWADRKNDSPFIVGVRAKSSFRIIFVSQLPYQYGLFINPRVRLSLYNWRVLSRSRMHPRDRFDSGS